MIEFRIYLKKDGFDCFSALCWLCGQVAEALGIEITQNTNRSMLRGLIGDLLKHSGLFLIFDEAHFLIPRAYNKRTPPSRLNWIRTQLHDRKMPVVIAVTPQWFDGDHGDATKFEELTHFAMEQLKGRWLQYTLPDVLPESDLLELVRFYLPAIEDPSDCMDIASFALTTDNFIEIIESIGLLARDAAQQQGIPVTMKLVRNILAELFPDQSQGDGKADSKLPMDAPDAQKADESKVCALPGVTQTSDSPESLPANS